MSDRENFEKWKKEHSMNLEITIRDSNGDYQYIETRRDWYVWQNAIAARQPEIDALNAKLESREAQMETVGSIERDLRNELARLKAENERLRYLKDNFVRCEPKMDGKHHWIAKGRLIGSGNTFEEAIVALMKETK